MGILCDIWSLQPLDVPRTVPVRQLNSALGSIHVQWCEQTREKWRKENK